MNVLSLQGSSRVLGNCLTLHALQIGNTCNDSSASHQGACTAQVLGTADYAAEKCNTDGTGR